MSTLSTTVETVGFLANNPWFWGIIGGLILLVVIGIVIIIKYQRQRINKLTQKWVKENTEKNLQL